MNWNRRYLGVVVAVAGLGASPMAGCSSKDATNDEPPRSKDPTVEFERRVHELRDVVQRCVDAKACRPLEQRQPGSPAALAPQGLLDLPSFDVSRGDFCKYARMFRHSQHAYFFIGGSVAAARLSGAVGGVDNVWDLWNQQAAGFVYLGLGFSALIGVSVDGYTGFGFGAKPSVLDAWSGNFVFAGVAGSIPFPPLPIVSLGLGASLFKNGEDLSLVGGAVSAGVSVGPPNPIKIGKVTGGGIGAANWVPNDDVTDWMKSRGTFAGYDPGQTKQGTNKGQTYNYLQFDGGVGLAFSIYANTSFIQPGIIAIVIDQMRDTSLNIDEWCPCADPSMLVHANGEFDCPADQVCSKVSASRSCCVQPWEGTQPCRGDGDTSCPNGQICARGRNASSGGDGGLLATQPFWCATPDSKRCQ